MSEEVEGMESLRRTPLYDMHVAAKARMVPFAGWEMPVQYSGVLPEVKAVREGVGLFDVSHMGRVRVRGAGALAYLQYLVVSDVAKLPAEGGQGQYSLLCLEAGGVIDDIIVYRLGVEEFIVVVNASNRDKDLSWMRHHAAKFDVILEDESDRTALIAVQGPKAIPLVERLSDRDITMLPRFGVDETVIGDIQTMAARTGYTGEDGVELFCLAIDAPALWETLVEAGGVPCGLGARDTLRVEAALPLYGHEMDEKVTPYEARLGWVVKTDKDADFLGKSVLADLKAAPKRKVLVGIEMEGRGIPRENYSILAGDGGSEVVGSVTSGTFSPMKNKGVALARVDAAHAKTGTMLDVLIRETRHAARVVPLPFYKNV
jgi:aminomethyltransferase